MRIWLILLASVALAQTGEPLSIHGSVRSRVELWDWFDGAGDSNYAFSGNQLRLSIGQTTKRFDWMLEAEAAMVFLKQGFVRYKSGRHTLRAGRFEFSDGAELAPSNPTLAWLKRERIAQRLIGAFGWSHVGRSFDGLQYVWSGKNTNVTAVG